MSEIRSDAGTDRYCVRAPLKWSVHDGRSASPSGGRMQRRRAVLLFTAIAVSLASPNFAATEKGWFGLGFSADVDGVFNPTLRSITVTSVVPSSPAAQAGLAPGDAVLEIQGIVVAGAKPDLLRAALQKSVGETLRLRVKHGTAETREVSMVAVGKPQER
jgi:predicted metalloprotease with PDZ domain